MEDNHTGRKTLQMSDGSLQFMGDLIHCLVRITETTLIDFKGGSQKEGTARTPDEHLANGLHRGEGGDQCPRLFLRSLGGGCVEKRKQRVTQNLGGAVEDQAGNSYHGHFLRIRDAQYMAPDTNGNHNVQLNNPCSSLAATASRTMP